MSERKQFEIAENCQFIHDRDFWTCQRCGMPSKFVAHRIAKSKTNLKKYGPKIVHHPHSLAAVCEKPECNDYFNIGNNPGAVNVLIYIIGCLDDLRTPAAEITEILNKWSYAE